MHDDEPLSVLVAGGSGFIGRHLVPRLLRGGMEVTVLSRDPVVARRVLPDAVRCIARVEDRVGPPPRVLVNLAGAGIADRPWTARRRRLLLDSRVAWTEALHRALADQPPEVVINASAIGYYGTAESGRFTEDDGPGSGFAADLCARWEDAAGAFAADGARLVRTRLGIVLGPGGMLARLRLPFSLGLGGRLGHGRQPMSWIHLEDVLGLMVRAIEDPQLSGPLNLTAPNPVSNAEFTRALGRTLHRPTPFPVPAFVLRTLLGDMAEELLLSGAAVIPERAEQHGYRFRFPRIDDALADLTD
jgi:hypothetical protein